MQQINPLVAAMAIAWTIIGGACVVTSVAISLRKDLHPSKRTWNLPSHLYLLYTGAAALAYLATALPLERATSGGAAFTALLAAMMASALEFSVVRGRWPWVPLVYAASGGALYGAMPL